MNIIHIECMESANVINLDKQLYYCKGCKEEFEFEIIER